MSNTMPMAQTLPVDSALTVAAALPGSHLDGEDQPRRTPFQRIQDLILARNLRPGDPLPTEAELCAHLRVSRSSVREAIRTLSSLDIVEVRHGHGTFVSTLSLAPLVDGLLFRARMNVGNDLRTVREVVDLRTTLDLSVADDLIAAYRGRSVTELTDVVDQMRQRAERSESFSDQDCAFHTLLLAPLGHDLISQLVEAFWRVHTVSLPLLGVPQAKDILDTVNAHQEMIDAITAGDPQAYREAVVNHYAPLRRVLDSRASTA